MSCKMKIEQLKEAICSGNEEVKSGGCLENDPNHQFYPVWVYLFFYLFRHVMISHDLMSLFLKAKICYFTLRKKVRDCSAGRVATKRRGIRSSVITVA